MDMVNYQIFNKKSFHILHNFHCYQTKFFLSIC